MTNLTKVAIKEAYIKLLNEKPLDKITVRDIAEKCKINRNTFYYHFHDLPSLFEEVALDEMRQISDSYSKKTPRFIDDADSFPGYVVKNKNAISNIRNSSNRKFYENIIMTVYGEFTKDFIDNFDNSDIQITYKGKDLIVDLLNCEIFGQVIKWLNSDFDYDIIEYLHELCNFFYKLVDALKNSRI
ncbi:MAG: TetR/AcrR family transcriptional regulator [Clostridiales bacterium]|nr:TetR/AcrR family transcriptional regulator [Clostridiales bacterium]